MLTNKKLVASFAAVFRVRVRARENEGTEREAQGFGRDMSCPRKLFLDERKSLF